MQLYMPVNDYRKQNDLPKLSLSVLSKSLTKAARMYVKNSDPNQPENQVDERGI